MKFIGEHLLPGQIGNMLILLALMASLVATFSFCKATQSKQPETAVKWSKLARISFYVQTISVILVFGILFYIIQQHLFEYKYAWQHSSLRLEAKYLLACFWEGQEGSFLLWSFWHSVLGCLLIRFAKDWESPVMTVVSFAQVCLASMVAGIYLFDSKIGSNPFVLLRNEINGPVFSLPDYLSYIKDGNDLNPLLQNYWMVIHPPVLFLGFAACIVPFAYSIAALWTRRYHQWIKPALPWALFAAALLGTGIMMGAMWAYESLTFGGYWAWDPVENASLVPWLLLVAGIHTLLIYKHTGRSLKLSHLFIVLSFLLVLYSTYLTRSGILGDSSVHAFTSLGMNLQLLVFLLVFFVPAILLFLFRSREILPVKKEESLSSRECWMLAGSLVLLISALSIGSMTSIPVYNKLAGFFTGKEAAFLKPLAIGENAEHQYNQVQIYVAIMIGLLTAIVQYLNYQKTQTKKLIQRIGIPTLIAAALSVIIIYVGDIRYGAKGVYFEIRIWLAIWAGVYSVVANLYYLLFRLRMNIRLAGSVLTHTGFAILLIGILISSSGKSILSQNRNPMNALVTGTMAEKPGENLTLLKDVRTSMGDFWVTYRGDSVNPHKPLWYYTILFERKDTKKNFTLQPNAFVNYKGNNGLLSNPVARHYWDHDIFMYVSSVPDPSNNRDTVLTEKKIMKVGDSVRIKGKTITLTKLIAKTNIPNQKLHTQDTAFVATLHVVNSLGVSNTLHPILLRQNKQSLDMPDSSLSENYKVRLSSVSKGIVSIEFDQTHSPVKYVTVKIYAFPFINLVWLGCLLMVIGFIISMLRYVNRIKRTVK